MYKQQSPSYRSRYTNNSHRAIGADIRQRCRHEHDNADHGDHTDFAGVETAAVRVSRQKGLPHRWKRNAQIITHFTVMLQLLYIQPSDEIRINFFSITFP